MSRGNHLSNSPFLPDEGTARTGDGERFGFQPSPTFFDWLRKPISPRWLWLVAVAWILAAMVDIR